MQPQGIPMSVEARRANGVLVRIALTTCLLACVGAVHAAAPALAGIDVCGTSVFNSAAIRTEFSKDLAEWSEAKLAGNSTASEAARKRIVTSLQQRGDFALVDATLMQYFRKPTVQYLTIDVVEREDVARRMPFTEPPQGEVADPEGVIALWAEYQRKLLALRQEGNWSSEQCEVLHCLLPFKPFPELFPYLERLNDKVQRNESVLYAMVAQESKAVVRGMALYMLAHSKDAERLLPALGRAIYDPAPYVRNNAMRMMGQMAERYPDLDYPIQDLVRAMDFAIATDRNKALYVLSKLGSSRHRERIAQLALPGVLQQLRLEQPIHHDPAFELLKGLSGERYGERDYATWERWVAERSWQGKPPQ
jgi:hypothetical protein